jgi:hypothetical protein
VEYCLAFVEHQALKFMAYPVLLLLSMSFDPATITCGTEDRQNCILLISETETLKMLELLEFLEE